MSDVILMLGRRDLRGRPNALFTEKPTSLGVRWRAVPPKWNGTRRFYDKTLSGNKFRNPEFRRKFAKLS